MIRTSFVLALVCSVSLSHAETILKIDLGSAGEDFQLVGTTLSTVNDAGATVGDQDTNINFTGFLGGMTDIPTDTASFSLYDVELSGSAMLAGGIVVQPTTGGSFKLWDDADALLLAGSLNDGTITGVVGPSAATGSFINIDLATVTGGSLAPLLDPNSLSLAISFTSVNDGAGFSVSGSMLEPFDAAATANIAALVPEPSAICLGAFALLGICGFVRGRRE